MNNPNVHTLYTHDVPLGVVCKRCGRRALIPVSKLSRWDGKGDMTSIDQIARRLKCEVCNLKETHGFVPPNKSFAERWVESQILETPGLD